MPGRVDEGGHPAQPPREEGAGGHRPERGKRRRARQLFPRQYFQGMFDEGGAEGRGARDDPAPEGAQFEAVEGALEDFRFYFGEIGRRAGAVGKHETAEWFDRARLDAKRTAWDCRLQ
eukprot:CAMPEP_0113297368 /NCGR_PEP_ID=MMETSP0010_2-20120614/262_1 /TAXON_ID=216773 ORGANISM="Corethron hystrix, Strain 308" /NCGR_SAMPLE_ID=MMETSP0010_2 /ASSEMBLY_ACC=CAM_ASM_000155 /LENGTH=117 /DNA_ID=CAMNT_0000150251 /DNA_START=531 /DNA_END=881 /DNA_ORIENTATION=- /assembly_acc=CAM_ASM_000155